MAARLTARRPAHDASGQRIGRSQRAGLVLLVALICLPHLWHLAYWVSVLVALLLAWQALALARSWAAPPTWLRACLTLAVVGSVFISFGRINGQDAGVALLTLMLALKLSEVTRYRDVIVVLCLCCFVLATQFLFSQSLLMAAYLVIGSWLVVAGFVSAHDQPTKAGYAHAGAESARMLALAIPVAAVFFVLFPRLPGPLWGLPANHSQATTGLADRMSPGSISSLARSDKVAMRVRFTGPVPAPAERYWRGPVFWGFHNGSWGNDRQAAALPAARLTTAGAPTVADITLAPTHNRWLIALDLPLSVNRPYQRSPAGTLLAADDINQRIRYIARSAIVHTLDARLSPAARQRALALPGQGNPRARRLAQRWAQTSSSPAATVHKALQLFRQQPFRYTLNAPPTSQSNSVDDFLFSTRAGFCEHFAGAFTFLMRAAGIPARVVTGFQGAEHSTVGDYWIVRNADAHAWSEVWLAGRGWVRVDPTAAVAPSRIERGITSAVSDRGDLPFMARRQSHNLWYQAGMAWDAVNAGWNRWFLAYGPALQQRLFARLGLAGFGSAIVILTLATVGLLALISLWLAWRTRPQQTRDPVEREWLAIQHRLARVGLARRIGEAPRAYGERVAAWRSDLAEPLTILVDQLVALRYGPAPDPALREQFIARARRFRPRRIRTHR